MQRRQLAPEPFGQGIVRRRHDESRRIGAAGEKLGEVKGRADDRRIVRERDRRRRRNPRIGQDAQQREFVAKLEAEAELRQPVRAQHETARRSVQHRIDAPVPPDRAAAQRFDRQGFGARGAACAGNDRGELRKIHTAPTACPPSTGSTAPLI